MISSRSKAWKLTNNSELKLNVAELMKQAQREDVGSGDHTSLATIDTSNKCTAQLIVKENGILSGIDVAKEIFSWVNAEIKFKAYKSDGDQVTAGDLAFEVAGNTRQVLTTERTVLNLMQRMSGIATTTENFTSIIAHTKANVLDTRKTTPGLRWFEKMAVLHGGAQNHRKGLYDMILIKDNHIDAAGSITKAVANATNYLMKKDLDLKIEVEVRNDLELDEALLLPAVDRIMLDNFSVNETAKAVERVDGRVELESSGGITLSTIVGYAEAGVDYISVGALTHSVKSLDMSLKIRA